MSAAHSENGIGELTVVDAWLHNAMLWGFKSPHNVGEAAQYCTWTAIYDGPASTRYTIRCLPCAFLPVQIYP